MLTGLGHSVGWVAAPWSQNPRCTPPASQPAHPVAHAATMPLLLDPPRHFPLKLPWSSAASNVEVMPGTTHLSRLCTATSMRTSHRCALCSSYSRNCIVTQPQEDILREAALFGNRILVKHENEDLSLFDHWEPVTAADVQTPNEVYAELRGERERWRDEGNGPVVVVVPGVCDGGVSGCGWRGETTQCSPASVMTPNHDEALGKRSPGKHARAPASAVQMRPPSPSAMPSCTASRASSVAGPGLPVADAPGQRPRSPHALSDCRL